MDVGASIARPLKIDSRLTAMDFAQTKSADDQWSPLHSYKNVTMWGMPKDIPHR